MTDDARERLRQHLVVDEGLRLKPYRDTVGKTTIGIGRNLDDVGITAAEAYALLEHDIDTAVKTLVARFPWVARLDPVRQSCLVNLTFNMGIARLSQFVNTLAAVERGDYDAAADGLMASKWYRQVQPSRSYRLVRMMRTGQYPNEDRA
ncbi:MAG TPA: glycoside hydrolase family protein [Gemmatimonadaceae bacterium]|nr:glycoside hydrolase family protein [Gemmatimonadaceae bacterium]